MSRQDRKPLKRSPAQEAHIVDLLLTAPHAPDFKLHRSGSKGKMRGRKPIPPKRSPAHPTARWQLQDAKAKFSQLFDQAIADGPQTVTRHNKQAVIVLSQEDYDNLKHSRKSPSLVEAFLAMPKVPGFKIPERDKNDLVPPDKSIFD
ncbi:MAG: type II toxin-antitoxin system Phd/YefM family antitoxin [Phycisphaerales bacterium]|nr:type II toxin-antitoxin system Phd/YefM family antitoxin [Phycisphaerales bacterium]